MALRNRLVMSSMTTDYAEPDHTPSPRLLDYLEARARGGVGLVTVEACTVDTKHREVPAALSLGEDRFIEGHREICRVVQRHGARVQPQLTHPGPDSMAPWLERIPSVGPSIAVNPVTGVACRELAEHEIEGIVAQFGDAARRAREAGYDGIELHAAHAYMLLGSFLSPWRNKRSDRYSGATTEGRLALLLDVIASIRRCAGDDFPITLRISGYERVPGGRDIHDTQRIAPRLEAAGVAAFHVSGGVSDRLVSQIVCGSAWPDGHNVAAAAAVRSVVGVPVMVVGRIHDPRFAERILAEGSADLIAMARPLLADPELPAKAARGAFAEIRRCISCEGCIDSMARGKLACAVNATTGREGEFDLGPAPEKKKVLVVGGGPGGMEAARVAALRGHEVVLCERGPQLGGSLVLAATVHRENQGLLDHLCAEMRRLPIDLRLGVEVTRPFVERLAPDAVVIACGGALEVPKLPGDEQRHVWSGPMMRRFWAGEPRAEDARRLSLWSRLVLRVFGAGLRGWITPGRARSWSRLWMPFGRRVVVVGGDLASVELAEFVAERGRRVQWIGTSNTIAPEVGRKRRAEHMERLDRLGVVVNTEMRPQQIGPGGIVVADRNGVAREIEGDTIILAGELVASQALTEALSGSAAEIHEVGDCGGVGLIRQAMEDAVRVASAL